MPASAGSAAAASSRAKSRPLASPPPRPTIGNEARVAERRLVTVLFADLVGFTSLAEGRDPEHVRELLTRYFDLAREVVERHGGLVEKFIGDAVMALWGAPVAHEDDAERAVRAALELVDAVHALGPGLEARGGVLTGEAAVTLGAIGQGMVAGDLVNTASRLQAAAAPGSVLVGEATQHAASIAITFEPVDEQYLKGKAAPVAAWRAVRVVAQRRGRGREDRLEAPFVGRDAELRLLKDLFHATTRDRRVRLVSITGQAGVGKSRLAWEFLKYVDGVVDAVFWHEGRSPAYGQGLSFWALGEMVRSRADLLETDDEQTTRSKIRASVERFITDEDEGRRVEAALLALLGVGDAPEGGSQGMFAAWRTYFERITGHGTVALLFEDLHWADSGMLDFIDHMLDWSLNVPILIVTLARTELLDNRPGWGAGRRNFLALDLQPLDDAGMRELLSGLVSGLPEPAIRSIVSRAEGIPLYAVETIRMLVADGRLIERDDGRFEPARRTGRPRDPRDAPCADRGTSRRPAHEDRMLVQDAAVLGQSFTTAALAAVSGLEADVLEQRLGALVRADLFHREVDPRSPERGQYAFVQAVIREVAYSTLAMRDRRGRHLAAARYFESLGDDELAGALATHYLAAYRSAPDGPEAEALASQARIALRAAADRAIALGSPLQAVQYLEQAIEVTVSDEDRAGMLEQAGEAASIGARTDQALPLLEQAQEIRERLGDERAVARVIGLRARALYDGRQHDESVALLRPAVERFAAFSDDPVGITLTAILARNLIRLNQYAEGLELLDRVLAAAERVGAADIAAEGMVAKGIAYGYHGRMWEARALYGGARQLAEEIGRPDIMGAATQNLSFEIALDDPRLAVDLQRQGVDLARRLGQSNQRDHDARQLVGGCAPHRRLGLGARRDQCRPDAPSRRQRHRPAPPRAADPGSPIEASRTTPSSPRSRRALVDITDPDIGIGLLDIRAILAFAAGRSADAAAPWLEVAGISDLNQPYVLPRAGHAFVLAGDDAGAEGTLERLRALGTRGRAVDADRAAIAAGIAGLRGDPAAALTGYRTAIAAWRGLGLPWDEALTVLEAVTVLGTSDPEVAGWADVARETFQRLRATPLVERLDEAVAATPAPRAPTAATVESQV